MTQQLKPRSLSPRKLTYEEFLEWDGENQHVEWVDGEVIPMAPIGDAHLHLGRWLITLLGYYVDKHRLGILGYEPFQMKTGPDLPGRSPDLFFLAKKNCSRFKKNHLEGPADLVIEIISPGSRVVDRVEKYAEYEEGGVREYWLIDPRRKQAEFYQLGRDGRYSLMAVPDGVFHSTVLKGLWLQVAWMWEDPLPPTPDVIKNWDERTRK